MLFAVAALETSIAFKPRTEYYSNSTLDFVQYPNFVAMKVDKDDNIIVVDEYSMKIQRIDAITGILSTIAGWRAHTSVDGIGRLATFNTPVGIALDTNNNIYVAEANANKVRKITTAGVVTTIAGGAQPNNYGDGVATAMTLGTVTDVAIDFSGDVYILGDTNIRKLNTNGLLTTIYTSGVFPSGRLDGLVLDKLGALYFGDSSSILQVSPSRVMNRFAGSSISGYADGPLSSTQFNSVSSITVDDFGNMYVADDQNDRIRRIDSSGIVTTLVGNDSGGSEDGIGTEASINQPVGIAVTRDMTVYVTSRTHANQIRKFSLLGNEVILFH